MYYSNFKIKNVNSSILENVYVLNKKIYNH